MSVVTVTYNHAPFIAQTIESVLAQETTFDFELVIGDDASTDGTREIIQDYQRVHPDRIRVLYHPRNLGPGPNFDLVLQACRGEYLAVLDGDDYWTSPHKVQLQADLLDTRPDCAVTFHAVEYVDDHGCSLGAVHPPVKPAMISTIQDLLVENFIPTPSVMFRNYFGGKLPQWHVDLAVGDWPLQILNAQFGSIAFIDQVLGAYRVRTAGIWSGRQELVRLTDALAMYQQLRRHLGPEHQPDVTREMRNARKRLAALHREIGHGAAGNEDYQASLRHYAEAIRIEPRLLRDLRLVRDVLSIAKRRMTRPKDSRPA